MGKSRNAKRFRAIREHNVQGMMAKIVNEQSRSRKVILHQSGVITSNGSGNIASSLDVGSLTFYADYSDFTDHYDEYRIIGGRVKFFSTLGPGHTHNCSLLAMAYDNDGNAMTPSSTNEVIQYATSKTSDIGRDAKYFFTWQRPMDMRLWYDVSSPTNVGTVPYYATSLTASTTYVKFEVETVVEFRGRR